MVKHFRTTGIFAMSLAALLALSSCSFDTRSQTAETDTSSQLSQDDQSAAGTSAVNIYTDRHYDTDDAIYRSFTEQTGIQVNIVKLVQLGYSIPGAVITVGSISLFVSLDHLLQPVYLRYFAGEKALWLSTSVIMLLTAFTVRYLAVGYNSVSSGFNKMGVNFSEAARTLGHGKTASLFKVELPVLRNSLIAGFILTFIDIAKELPLTLMLRPFNFNTLASRVYEYANDERIHEASIPALLLIFFSSSAIVILARIQTGYARKRRKI